MQTEAGYDTNVGDRGMKLSGGPRQRLSIARAVLRNPEILILDEVLSVGDAKFKKKSEKKIRSMMKDDVTVLFVSHNINQVRAICNKAIILDHGTLVAQGDVEQMCDLYEQMLDGGDKNNK